MPDDIQNQFREGLSLFDRGRVPEAVELLETCHAAEPGNPHFALNLGHALGAAGDAKRAAQLYRALLDSAEPGMPFAACWSLADLKGYRFSNDEIRRMQAWASANDDQEQRYLLLFALGHALEQKGDYEQAFDAFRQANRQVAQQRPYPGEAWSRLAKSIEGIGNVPGHRGTDGPLPVFVVGMPRSGSTLLEQIIGAHSRAEAIGEVPFIENMARSLDRQGGFANTLPRLQPQHCAAGASGYREQARAMLRGDPDRLVDKWPDNFWYLGLVYAMFPAAPVINILRDPLDNALAVYKQFFSRGNEFSSDLDWTAHYWECYLDVVQHWESLFPGKVLHLRYRDLVRDPEGASRRVLEHCGLEFEPGVLEFHSKAGAVMTPSGQQVRRPIYASALGSADPYRPYLDEILPRFERITERANRFAGD